MSKTLASIAIVTAAIAVNVIPGVGQFISANLIAIGLTKAAALTITSIIATSVTAAGFASAASLLGLGPGGIKPDTAVSAIKTSRPPRVSGTGTGRLYGAYILFETASSGAAVDVYAVHDGVMTGTPTFYLVDEAITLTGNTVNEGADGRYRDGAVKVYWTDGATPGAGIPAVTSLVPEWDGRGDGVVLMALTAASVKAKLFQETYPQSQVPVLSMVAQWGVYPDPEAADPTDEAGWTWTENPVRHLLWYKLVHEGEDYATKIEPALASWIAAAQDCDDATALNAGGTEARYRSCVAFKHTDRHAEVVGAFLSTFDGWASPRPDGALQIYSGRYYEPTVSIGADEIVSYTWDGVGIDDDKAVNEIIVSYVSAEHDYNTVEGEAWRDEADITARGQVLSQPLEVQVPSFPQARRLAKRKIARIMAPSRGTVTTNVAGRAVRGERYINLTIEEAGATFYDGPAEIVGLVRNGSGGVTFEWVAADPNIDNWNPATEEGEPAAKGDRVAPAALVAPTISAASAIFDAGTVRLSLDVDSPDRADLTWFVHWRVDGASVWGPDETFPDTDAGASVTLVTGPVPAEQTIEVEVAYQVGDGRVSAWSAAETVDTSTASVAPAAPSEVSATGGVGLATVTWRNPTSANLSYVKVWRNTSSTFGTATDITGEVVGGLGEVMSLNDTGLAAGTYYYWVVAYNAADIASTPGGPDSAVVT